MRRSLRAWLSLRKKRKKVCRPLALPTFPRPPCVPKPALEGRARKFVGWEMVLHPSQPVVATRDIPWPTRTPKSRVEGRQIPHMISMKLPVSLPKTPTQPQPSPSVHALTLAWPLTPPQGFARVITCLHVPELVEVDLELPVGLLPVELVAATGFASMSSSCIIKDELMGVIYMDMVTTSIGRVTISGPGLEAFPASPTT